MAREMKDSGIEWIGKIPSNWEVCRIKNLAKVFTGNSIKDEEKEFYEDQIDAIPYIATKDIDASMQTINYDNGMYVKSDNTSFKHAPAQSTLLCIEGGSAGKKIGYAEQEVCFVNKLCCFHAENASNKYIYYFLMSPAFTQRFTSNISGLIGGVSVSEIKNFEITSPSIDEQKRIADFLDTECSRIDAVIEQTRASIEEYKKLKQAVITQAVTKGIRPNRVMKDSGDDWIGDMPKDWLLTKVKYVSSLVTDGAHVSPETEDGIYDFVSTVNIDGNKINFDNCLKTSITSYNYLVSTGCKPQIGDVLISKDGTVGKTVIVNEEHDFVVASSLVIIRPKQEMISSEYLNYSLQSKTVQDTLLLLMHGAGLKRVSVAKNANLPLLLPDRIEQDEIFNYLNDKCKAIDLLIQKKEQYLLELESFKKALIYEYVTGKKEVK